MRVGVDIGGTFTDCAVVDDTGRVLTGKALSTSDAVAGVIGAIENAAREADWTVEHVLSHTDVFVHGTTIGTNAVLERRGAPTGLITTRGHEDSILIGKLVQKRAGLSEQEIVHVSNLIRPEPIVPRERIVGVHERIDRDGEVLVALNEDEVADALRRLVERHHIESLAVSFLWSFLEPRHERRVREIALELYPHLFVTISSEIAPVIGEYERTVTAVLNAYIGVAMRGYLSALEDRLRSLGFDRTLLVMEAGGGVAPASYARDNPIVTLDSGPVGGVAGARFLGANAADGNVICTDVGGTSFDVALIVDGAPQFEETPVIDKFTYQLPKVAVASVGAGGGSLAHVDEAGILHVGPESSGSEPGPACYGRGGERATVTDADLVLGYLSPERFWGGRMVLDEGRATAALQKLGDELNMSAVEAAAAVVTIANANMADLIRKHTVEHGRDPRDFTLFAYGGAGPVHGGFYGEELGVRQVCFVRNAGVFSAFGMVTSDIAFSESMSSLFRSPFSDDDAAAMAGVYEDLESRIRGRFEDAQLDATGASLQRILRARFNGQVNEVAMEVGDALAGGRADGLVEKFTEAYESAYGPGTAYPDAGFEVVTFRVSARIPVGEFALDPGMTPGSTDPTDARKAVRPMYSFDERRFVDGDVYEDVKLRPGMVVRGPAVIERDSDTVVVPPASRVVVDRLLNLFMEYDS